jgi:hypothetical protein
VPNFGGAYGENNIGGFLLPDEFNGWDFDGWYEQYVAGGRVLSHECDTSPIPPLMIAPTEGFCRNPWPMHPGVKLDWEMTIYQASSGAWVFNAATNEWAWGLDDYFTGIATPGGPDNGPAVRPQCGYSWFHPNLASCRHPAIEQITRNVLNRFIRGE